MARGRISKGLFGGRVPADVRAVVPGGGRVLAWERTDPTGVLVATHKRLVCTAPELDVPWVDVLGAAWDDPILELVLLQGESSTTWRCHIVKAEVLPQVVRERIMQSLLVQHYEVVAGGRGVRFLARRDPEGNEAFWQRVVDPGLDVTRPEVAARIADIQTQLMLTYGV